MKHSLFPRAMKKEIVTFATMAIGILATCAVAQQATDSTSPASSGATTVNDLAADPSAYLGQVAVVGVVAAVKAGQGFTIVDKRGKPLMALISLMSVAGGYLYLLRRPECNCTDPQICPFPGKSGPASARQNSSPIRTDLDRKETV